MVAKVGFENGSVMSTARVAPVVTPIERAVNGNLNTWSTKFFPNSYELTDAFTQAYGNALFQRSATAYAGSYAMEMTVGTNDIGGGNYLTDIIANMGVEATKNQTIQAKVYARRLTGSANLVCMYFYEDGEDEYVYNFTGVNAGTWTIMMGAPTSDQMEIKALTDSYVQQVFTTATFPDVEGIVGFEKILAVGTTGNKVLLDSYEVFLDAVNVATDSGFETWTEYSDQSDTTVTSWTLYNGFKSFNWTSLAEMENSYILRDSVDKPAGMTYSAKMFIGAAIAHQAASHRQYIHQIYTGTIGVTLASSIWHKNGIGYIIFLNGAVGAYTQVWNKTTNAWVNLSGVAITDFPEGSSDYFVATGSDVAWTEYASESPTVPASGNITVVCLSNKPAPASPLVCSWGDISLIENVTSGGTPANNASFINKSDASTMDANDVMLNVGTSGGTPKTFLKQNGLGAFTTDFTQFDFSNKPVKVASATDGTHVYTKTQSDTAIATAILNRLFLGDESAEINHLNDEELVTLYTVPTGYKFVIHAVHNRMTALEGAGMAGILAVGGNNPDYGDSGCSFSAIAALGISVAFPSGAPEYAAGTVIKARISSAATGYTNLKSKLRICGILVAV